MAVVKSLPAEDTGAGVTCVTASGENFRISQNPTKGIFTLWKIRPTGYEKIATANSPIKLYAKIDWEGAKKSARKSKATTGGGETNEQLHI